LNASECDETSETGQFKLVQTYWTNL